ncbi:MAG: sulfatase/phosphatase domain-containing protein [Verrucomicrobiota bacterium]
MQRKRYDGMSCTLDFYPTITSVAGLPAPDHLDGVNLIPYLREDKKGDPHEYLYWLNNDPNDSEHRHLTAARWKDFRLYKHKELGWQLFNLKTDPTESNDIAKAHPEVLKDMIKRHEAWTQTLAEQGTITKTDKKPNTGYGYGWWDGSDES